MYSLMLSDLSRSDIDVVVLKDALYTSLLNINNKDKVVPYNDYYIN